MPKQQEVDKYYVILGQYNIRHVFKYITYFILIVHNFVRFFVHVFISLNLVFLEQFYSYTVFTCAIDLYRFLHWLSVTSANFLDFYRKNFLAQILLFL